MNLPEVLFEQRNIPRADWQQAHISDLFSCDKATWLRRSGEAPEGHSPETLRRFALGLGYESQVRHTLWEAGYDVREDVVVDLEGLIGHIDLLVMVDGKPSAVIEIKTNGLRSAKPVSTHYAIQALAYAKAMGLEEATVLVAYIGDLNHIVEVEYPLLLDSLATNSGGKPIGDPWSGWTWNEIITQRIAEVIERTDPEAPMPPADPGVLSPWACSYCRMIQCERNPKNPAAFAFGQTP